MTHFAPFLNWLGQFHFKALRRRFVEHSLHRCYSFAEATP